jgi:hypothetical protein
VTLDGSLGLPALPGVSLLVPTVNFTVKRTLAWGYNEMQEVFRTAAAVTGNLTLVQSGPGASSSSSSANTPSVTCVFVGLLYMSSTTYPGPGLTSNYQWSGNVTLSPDPWTALGLVSPSASPAPSPAKKRLLLSAAAPGSVALEQPEGGSAAAAAAGCGFGGGGISGDEETCPNTETSTRHLLQANNSSSNTPAANIAVSGSMRVLEYSALAPSLADEAARGDGEVWLDSLGAIRMRGKVPESLVPAWKQIQQAKGGALSGYKAIAKKLGVAPFWAIIGGGILAVGLFIFLMWCCCCRKPRGGGAGGPNQGEVVSVVLGPQNMMMAPGYPPHRGASSSYTTSPAAVAGGGGMGGSMVRGRPQVYIHEAGPLSPGASGAQSDPSYSSGTKARRGSSYTNSGDPNGHQIGPWWGEEEAQRTVSPMSRGMSPAGMLRVNSPPTSRSGSPSPAASSRGRQQQQHHRPREERHGRSGARRSQLNDSRGTPPHSPRRSAWD